MHAIKKQIEPAEQKREKGRSIKKCEAVALTICSTDHPPAVSESSRETQPSSLHQCIKLGVVA
jgi:hypothetical protein